ncbi:MAG: serine/threonine-protein kinase [Acidobacteriota bacterium]|nr:serine/threonine-protein kinase [Acidobacteriota bacterium]
MTLTPGPRLGPYEIVAAIGAGGMGEVYRARDAKLNRDVALKIVSGAFIDDPDRLARFRREAQVLASLNHPTIAAIYGLEDSGATHALVLELVEGPTLADRIAEGPIALVDAIPIAKQTAEALDAAHQQGIIHRDLKPANIKVRGDGTVKVLDFGLAKAMDPAATGSSANAANSPTLTGNATAMGTIIGTAAYMSPEQARGRTVDKRADIWAFGAVVYELISGRAAFPGDTTTDILAAVVRSDPDWTALPAATPASIRRLLARCLDKDPKRRLRDIGDAQLELEFDETIASATGAQRQRSRWWHTAPWILAAVLAVALAVSLAGAFGRPTESGSQVRRFTIEIPSKSAPNWSDFRATISTDGTHVAYNCREGNTVSLCVRALDSLTARRVADGRDATDWFFSPDGEWIGIADDVGLSKVSIRGGEPQTILRWPGQGPAPVGFSWESDNSILFGTASGIQRVSASGGSAEPVTRIAPGSGVWAHSWPSLLPDRRNALITIVRADGTESAGLVNMNDGSVRDLGIRGHGFMYLHPGWLAFQQGTTVLAAAFDPGDPTRAGNPVPVIENVSTMPRAARDGSLVYIPTRGESNARLVWVDRAGRPTAVEGQRLDYTHLDLAPDGRRALLNLADSKVDLIDLQLGTRKQLVEGSFPIWSSNGERVTFTGPGGLHSAHADGSSRPEVLVSHPGFVVPTSWNAVTGDLAYYDHRTFEISIRSADGKTRRFLGGPGRKRSGRFSPDGKWMAFVSDETGEYQVYVTAYPGPGPTVAVSARGGLSPIWSADGRELYFRLGTKLLAARMSSQSPVGFTVPVELFDGPYTLDLMGHQREDVAPDGRFLMVENSDDFPIVIVQHWPLELERLVR